MVYVRNVAVFAFVVHSMNRFWMWVALLLVGIAARAYLVFKAKKRNRNRLQSERCSVAVFLGSGTRPLEPRG